MWDQKDLKQKSYKHKFPGRKCPMYVWTSQVLFIFFYNSLTFNFKTPSGTEVFQILLNDLHKYEERITLKNVEEVKCTLSEVIAWRVSPVTKTEL